MQMDIDKTRAEYVTHLETQLNHIVARLNEALVKARWEPIVEAADEGDVIRFVLTLVDKKVSVHIKRQVLIDSDVTSLTSAIVETMVLNLVSGQLKTVVEPEVVKMKQSVTALQNAGQW